MRGVCWVRTSERKEGQSKTTRGVSGRWREKGERRDGCADDEDCGLRINAQLQRGRKKKKNTFAAADSSRRTPLRFMCARATRRYVLGWCILCNRANERAEPERDGGRERKH